MTTQLNDRINNALSTRRENGLLRQLRPPQPTAADFSSNDYLGISRSASFRRHFSSLLENQHLDNPSGSTGSRLLSGHSADIHSLEQRAATFHEAQSCLLFNSGYDANLSVLSCIPGPDDIILYDRLIHASVHDGMRMSRANNRLFSFAHNNINSLREALCNVAPKSNASIVICVESVYSMDGDVAPIKQILQLASSMQSTIGREIHVVVDEAHAGGLYGPNGEGYVYALGLQHHPNLLARVLTFGKAFGAHGAVVLASKSVVQYLVNYARPFIYSTALPPHSIQLLHAVYSFTLTKEAHEARAKLWQLVDLFHITTRNLLPPGAILWTDGKSPIQGILVPGNQQCVNLSNVLRERGFDVYPIRSPTVPTGTERIRIILHAHNTKAEVERLVCTISQAIKDFEPRPRL